MKSRAQLIRRIVALLGEAFPGELITDDDSATIGGYIDDKVAELSAMRVMYVQDADAIDEEVFAPLARLVAVEAALGQYHAAPPEFRMPLAEATKRSAEQTLRAMQIEPNPGETVRASYF